MYCKGVECDSKGFKMFCLKEILERWRSRKKCYVIKWKRRKKRIMKLGEMVCESGIYIYRLPEQDL